MRGRRQRGTRIRRNARTGARALVQKWENVMADRKVKLAVRGVHKTFRLRGDAGNGTLLNVLGGVSFDVYEGEIVSLIGESGCGKTTLLRIVQGLVRMDAGQILVDDVPATRPGRNRGFVFQQASLLPWRTARANVEFGTELMGMPKAERHARAYPHELSGGMQQRIGLARALAIDPAIMLMDEPFSALDAQTREVLQAELLRIQAETLKTTLFVTHDLDEAIYLSNRIVVLAARPGRVKKVIDVPFAHPRPPLPELRADPEFQRIRAEMWELIRATPQPQAA